MSRGKRVLAAWAIAILLVASSISPLLAAKPDRFTIDLDDPDAEAFYAELLSEACGAEIAVDFEGSVRVLVFTDRHGNWKREINKYWIRDTFTNVETGASVLLKDVGPDLFWLSRDGHLTLAITGRSLTGSGVIGRVVIDLDTGEVVHSAGKDVGSIADQVCPAIT